MRLRLPFEWMVALRYLREGRLQTALVLSGVTGGVAVIVFMTTLITQLQAAIIDRTLGSQAHVVIRPPEEHNRMTLPPDEAAAIVEPRAQRLRSVDQWASVMERAARMPGVVAVSPMVSGAGFAIRANASRAIALLGVDADRYRRIVRMDDRIVAGRFEVAGSGTVIGVELARELGVTVGDRIRVVTAQGRDDLLTIAGIFDMGTLDLNRRWVFTTVKLAQSLLDLPGGVSNVDLTVVDIFSAERIAERLRAATGLRAESWMQTNSQLLSALRNQTITNDLIRSFVALIVAVGIASVLVVSVVQKQREIGILRAMGTSRRRIMAVFLVQGGLLGLAGAVAGAGVAIGLVRFIASIFRDASGLPIFRGEIDASMVLQVCVLAVVIGLLAAALPARRAARMDPVQAIRL